jgi:hypothetical protein
MTLGLGLVRVYIGRPCLSAPPVLRYLWKSVRSWHSRTENAETKQTESVRVEKTCIHFLACFNSGSGRGANYIFQYK